jgi:hypothetical protein
MVAVMAASQVTAAGLPSQATLADMGLAGLSVMSDDEALAVRGFGYRSASAAGQSWASVAVKGGSAGSENSYNAKGKKVAKGHTLSFAAVEVEYDGGHGGGHGGHGSKGGKGCNVCKPQDVSIRAISGGSSYASNRH